MIVADSSYIVEGLLREASLLEVDSIIAPDLALYEVVNTLWKHESRVKDIRDASLFLAPFFELIKSEKIQMIRPDEELLRETYQLAVEEKITVYDAIYIALSIDLGLELRTFDRIQSRVIGRRGK